MLVFEVLLGLNFKPGYVTVAFIFSDVYKVTNIYVKISRGFNQVNTGKNEVLKLKNNIYGLIQSPCALWNYLTDKLEAYRLAQSKLDPCYFLEINSFI